MMQESFTKGVIYALLSAFALSLVGLLGKLGDGLFTLPALIFWRFFTAAIISGALVYLFLKIKNGFNKTQVKMNFIRAFFTLGAQGSFYYYIQTGSLLDGMVLLNTGPLFIPLIERFILRRHVGKSSWIGLGVAFIGVLCILQPDAGLFRISSLIGLLAGLCQGISQTLFGVASRDDNPEFGVFSLCLFCAGISLIPYLIGGETWERGESLTSWSIALIAILGFVSVINQLTRSAAYQHGTPSRLSPFLYFAVPFSAFYDWQIFGEIPNLLTLIGTILVIGGALLKIYLRHKILKK